MVKETWWDRLGHKKMAHIDNGPGPDRNYIRENGRLKFWRKADNGPKIRFCYRTRISSMACLSPSARWLFWRLRIDLSTFLFWVTPVCVKKKTTRQKIQKAKKALALSACRDNEQKYARIVSGTIITDMRNTLFTKDIAQMLSSQICTFRSHVSPRSAAFLLTLNSPFHFLCAQHYHITEPCLLIRYKYAKTTCTFESNLPFHVQMSVILFSVQQAEKSWSLLEQETPTYCNSSTRTPTI